MLKLSELKNWNLLSPEEQARLKEVYGVEDDTPLEVTKTMAEKPPKKEGGKNA